MSDQMSKTAWSPVAPTVEEVQRRHDAEGQPPHWWWRRSSKINNRNVVELCVRDGKVHWFDHKGWWSPLPDFGGEWAPCEPPLG